MKLKICTWYWFKVSDFKIFPINTFLRPASTDWINNLIFILLFQINQSTYSQKVCGSKVGRHYAMDTFINPKAQKDSEGCRVLLTLHYRVINRTVGCLSLARTANKAEPGQLQFWSEPPEILNLRSSNTPKTIGFTLPWYQTWWNPYLTYLQFPYVYLDNFIFL